MKTTILNKVLYRVPKFPINATLADCWSELKEAIAVSSKDFYKVIQEVEADQIESLPPAIYQTIWKYFNRAKFRATPFGTFAGFGTIEFGVQEIPKSLVISNDQTQHAFSDWPLKTLTDTSMRTLLSDEGYVVSNHSFYKISDIIRYVSHIDGKFELSEIAYSKLVWDILFATRKKVKLSAFINSFIHHFNNQEDLLDGLEYLVSLDLLHTSRHPNIIGEDYFKRLNIEHSSSAPQYIITQRKAKSAFIDVSPFRHLPALVSRLHNITELIKNNSFEQFKADFMKRYEMREVALMEALDPETGIGYAGLEAQSPELYNEFAGKRDQASVSSQDTTLRDCIYNTLFNGHYNAREVIDLEKIPLKGTTEDMLPNSISALLSDAQGMLCLESLGGATANALIGRFTLADPEIESFCRHVASIESQANPEVLFFDIAYTAETSVDNVNRRKSVYDLQLSILNYNICLNPLLLNDLYLSVRSSQLVLRSKSLNKRLVPRLTTAYNYGRSDLAVFRLLCDLQHQGILTSLSVNLQQTLPGLKFYPRVKYRNIIVSRAKWKLAYPNTQKSDGRSEYELVQEYLKSNCITRYFRTGTADQTLTFDTMEPADLKAFLLYFKKQQTLWVEEAFYSRNTLVTDENGNPYTSEFVLSLTHQHEVYKRVKLDDFRDQNSKVDRIFLPGKDWLYFEIYCHPQRSNDILLSKVSVFLKQQNDNISQWFFIRYNENGYHIRLRIKPETSSNLQQLTMALTGLLEEDIQSGIISDFAIKTYKRELERYGPDNIEAVEAHFHICSVYAMALIALNFEPSIIYRNSATIVFNIRSSGLIDMTVFDGLICRICASLIEEHKVDSAGFKKLNSYYKTFKLSAGLANETTLPKAYLEFESSLMLTLKNSAPKARTQLFADLMHMHFNRIFSMEPRTQEMIFYYVFEKEMKSRLARQLQPAIDL